MRRTISTIICGKEKTTCLSNDGCIFSFGKSDLGAIAIEQEKYVFPPVKIPTLTNIQCVAGFLENIICLDYSGTVYTFGDNKNGQLGIGLDEDTLQYTHIPQKVNLPPCKEVSCGIRFAICLSEDGFIYSFGCNNFGQLGIGNNVKSYNTPQKIESLCDVEFIECGGEHVFCKTENNEVYSWGYNIYGQLGTGNDTDLNSPTICTTLSNEDIIDIKSCLYHTIVLKSNNEVFTCGYNGFGQLGRESDTFCDYSVLFQKVDDLSEIIRIECGYSFVMCIDINYDFFIFGGNDFGQLGTGLVRNSYFPMKHPSLSNIIDISSKGNYHTFVKTTNNEIYAFGKNNFSQLGIKTEETIQPTPIRVFEDKEDIWCSNINRPKAKSARFVQSN